MLRLYSLEVVLWAGGCLQSACAALRFASVYLNCSQNVIILPSIVPLLPLAWPFDTFAASPRLNTTNRQSALHSLTCIGLLLLLPLPPDAQARPSLFLLCAAKQPFLGIKSPRYPPNRSTHLTRANRNLSPSTSNKPYCAAKPPFWNPQTTRTNPKPQHTPLIRANRNLSPSSTPIASLCRKTAPLEPLNRSTHPCLPTVLRNDPETQHLPAVSRSW